MSAKISIVVPFYNVEAYFEECLESLARQTLRDIEVIMVDDGSPDGSTVIAKSYADRDPRFKLVQQENQGLGPARNAGLHHATGEYLAFVDSDDVVARFAYELMVGTLDETGSDMVCGNVRRFTESRMWQCWAHREPFATGALRTHVSARPNLMQDRMVWNKVFRRDFWDRHDLRFPGILYEDAPVMVRAHVLAEAVDVLSHHVYYWREREGSITQRKAELANLEDRMESIRAVHAFLNMRAPGLKAAYDRYALEVDLGVLTEALPQLSPEERERAVELGCAHLAGVDRAVLRGLPVAKRLRFHLLERRMLDELLDVLVFEKIERASVPTVRRGRFRPRFYAVYPYFQDPARAVPDEVYDITDELKLWGYVDDVRWEDGRLRIDGHAHFARLDVSWPGDSKIRLWLCEAKRGIRTELPVERVCRPDVTADSGQSAACYDWSGFAATIDPDQLRINGKWKAATWELHVEVTTQGLRRGRSLGSPSSTPPKWRDGWQPNEEFRVRPVASDGFLIQVQHLKAVLTGHRERDGRLELTGWTKADLVSRPQIVASRTHGSSVVPGPAELTPRPGGGWDFRAELPLDRLLSDPEAEDRVAQPARIRDGIDWDLRLADGATRLKLALPDRLTEGRYPVRELEFALTRTRYGNLRAVERARRPVVTSACWAEGDDGVERLILRGDFCGVTGRPGRLVLLRRRSSEAYPVPLSWDGDRFTAEITPAAMERFGIRLPLASGIWDLRAESATDGVNVVAARQCLKDLPEPRTLAGHDVIVETHQSDSLRLRVRAALGDRERGAYGQRLIQREEYPAFLRRPLKDLAVFDCYEGAQYGCSPRAIYEELRRRDSGVECVWVSRDGQFTVPGDARVVTVGSRAHYEAMAQARYVVGNYGQFPWFVKREGQTYLQTWHGTPLKRLAYDLRDMPYKRTETLDWMEREVPRWDVVLSPNPFTTPIMRRAFRYEGEILETGYPRNDILKSPEADRIAAMVRARLGIPPGKKVVLYAPTWRDDHHIAHGKRAFSLELDIEAARAALGDDHVLLIRTHYLVTDRAWSPADDFVVDVSAYPDIAELYLAADVLVTDYSSAMFDFAGTGKPMVFFTYDLERYRDHVRGFYFDLEAEAPGPLPRTTGGVLAALRSIDQVAADHADAYAAFVAKYCPYDDGRAAARVIDHVFTDRVPNGAGS